MTPEEWYEALLPLLLRHAVGRFDVPFEDAEDIAHEAVLSYLGKINDIRDPRQYLIAATSNGCRTYWRKQTREAGEPLPEERGATPPYIAIITVHRVLAALPPREREVLVLRAAGYKVKEIAVLISYSASGTEKVLRRAKKRAAALADPPDETERWRVGGGLPKKDTHQCAWRHGVEDETSRHPERRARDLGGWGRARSASGVSGGRAMIHHR